EIDVARAREYALLATLLTRTPDRRLLDEIAELKVDASPIGLAHPPLAEGAPAAQPGGSAREVFEPFIGVGPGAGGPPSAPFFGPVPSAGAGGRGCGPLSRSSESRVPTAITSRKIASRRCVRSWRGLPAASSRCPPAATRESSRSTSSPGPRASSVISSTRRP